MNTLVVNLVLQGLFPSDLGPLVIGSGPSITS